MISLNHRQKILLIFLSLSLPITASSTANAVSVSLAEPKYSFVSLTHTSLKSLSQGGSGRGVLLYYNGKNPHTVLAVILKKRPKSSIATALVYDDLNPSQIEALKRNKRAQGIHPVLKMEAFGGWWVRNGKPNYNLDVSVYGSIYAMWGADPGFSQSYLYKVHRSELLSTIEIRTGKHGIPLWDYRRLIPSFPNSGYLRVNYAQRESSVSHWTYLPSPSPQWPYIAYSGTFLQQTPNELNPPIVVNWKTGRVTRFSEVVSVRSQANGYDFYSLHSFSLNHVNRPDFESPWGFYNLAGKSEPLPNLIIRTQHYYAKDPFSVGTDPKLLLGKPLLNKPQEDVRYSWAVHPGNVAFDYKVDVYGFHSYNQVTSLAGGKIKVQAPSYQNYPSWVIGHRWPSTAFVEASPTGYRTSEGIYPWAAQDIGTPYWMGWSSQPSLKQFQSIPQGLRGEYRIGLNHHPTLYVSPIDDRLHLLYAQGGLWNLGHNYFLKEENLDGGPYINQWTLVQDIHGKNKTISMVAALPGYLIYSSDDRISIKQVTYNPSLFTILPPTNKSTWSNFVHKTEAYRQGKNPHDLASWLNAFPAKTISGVGIVKHISETPNAFTLEITDTNLKSWNSLLNKQVFNLRSNGPILLTYSLKTHHWYLNTDSYSPITAHLKIVSPPYKDLPAHINVTMNNPVPAVQSGNLKIDINHKTISNEVITLSSRETIMKSILWSPNTSGIHHIRIWFNNKTIFYGDINIKSLGRPNPLILWADSIPLAGIPPIVAVLTITISGLALILWRQMAQSTTRKS